MVRIGQTSTLEPGPTTASISSLYTTPTVGSLCSLAVSPLVPPMARRRQVAAAYRRRTICGNSTAGDGYSGLSPSRQITPRLTLAYPTLEAQRSARINAEVGGSSPPRPSDSGPIYDATVRTVFLDPDGTNQAWIGVVVAASTGVVYEHQCGRTACLRRSIEGYYVPVGGVAVGGEPELLKAPTSREFREFFQQRVGVESPRVGPTGWTDHSAVADLYRLVGSIPWWEHGRAANETKRAALAVDGEQEEQIVEGWIPVLVGSDGAGILVWPNSD